MFNVLRDDLNAQSSELQDGAGSSPDSGTRWAGEQTWRYRPLYLALEVDICRTRVQLSPLIADGHAGELAGARRQSRVARQDEELRRHRRPTLARQLWNGAFREVPNPSGRRIG